MHELVISYIEWTYLGILVENYSIYGTCRIVIRVILRRYTCEHRARAAKDVLMR
jgi:hypothetical protein